MAEAEGSAPSSPLVTLGVFCFNQGRFLPGALAAVAAQTYAPLEIFLVDDGSSDGSAELLRELAQGLPGERVTVIADGTNCGLAARMNQVIERAAGEWVVWIAADDELLPRGIAHLMAGATPDVDVVFADLAVMDEAGTSKGYSRPGDTWQGPAARRYTTPGSPVADILEFNNFVSGCAPAIRTLRLREVGGYAEDVRIEDLYMWLTLGATSRFRYVPQPVARYRMVTGSQSRREDAAMAELGILVQRTAEQGVIPPDRLARLVAMRWGLSVARTRGRPTVGLADAARLAGLAPSSVRRQLPRAVLDPIWRSTVAAARHRWPRPVSRA